MTDVRPFAVCLTFPPAVAAQLAAFSAEVCDPFIYALRPPPLTTDDAAAPTPPLTTPCIVLGRLFANNAEGALTADLRRAFRIAVKRLAADAASGGNSSEEAMALALQRGIIVQNDGQSLERHRQREPRLGEDICGRRLLSLNVKGQPRWLRALHEVAMNVAGRHGCANHSDNYSNHALLTADRQFNGFAASFPPLAADEYGIRYVEEFPLGDSFAPRVDLGIAAAADRSDLAKAVVRSLTDRCEQFNGLFDRSCCSLLVGAEPSREGCKIELFAVGRYGSAGEHVATLWERDLEEKAEEAPPTMEELRRMYGDFLRVRPGEAVDGEEYGSACANKADDDDDDWSGAGLFD